MSSQSSTYQFIVTGSVQGVGFRHFVLSKAQELQLSGWVRNLIDGRVEIMVCGEEVAVNKFAMEVNRGPAASNVISVERYPVDTNNTFSEFKIEKDGDRPWQE